MRRLGIALHRSAWRWAVVERGWRSSSITAAGEVEPGDWRRVVREAGHAAHVGVAVHDADAVLRRLQVGHPPQNRSALRALVKWRLRDDLPFDVKDAALDVTRLGDDVFALALRRTQVSSLEDAAAALGPVRVVSCLSIASFNAAAPEAEGEHVIAHEDGHAIFRIAGTALVLFVLRDGSPTAAPSLVVDTRTGAASNEWTRRAAWRDSIPAATRGRFAAAVGVAE